MTNPIARGAYVYKAAGALPISAPTYVKREADEELFQALLDGQYCYVLNTRQMGKSSLCVRTMARLRESGVVCGTVDLSGIASTEATQEQWYEALLDRLAESLGLLDEESGDGQGTDFERWEHENARLPASTRFGKFVEWLVLKKFSDRRVVIFFDEIESTLRKGFDSDDFFIGLRACYNHRAHQPELNRLTFAFLGVADPSDLIQDKFRTPFNVGRAVELYGFTLEEARPLAVGLERTATRPLEVLRAVLSWTGGQPFLTHKICMLVSETSTFISEGEEEEYVSRVVRERVIDNWSTHDNPRHLKTIENRIMESPKHRTAQLLTMYQQILKEGEIADDSSPEQMELRLSGLVVNQSGRLKVYNRIYAAVFNEQWVESSLARLRPYAEELRAWYASDCQDESHLLRGHALEIARGWIKGKSLGNADWVFLSACEQLERREMEKAFDAEQEANRILKSANEKAQLREARARRFLLLTVTAAILLMTGAAVYAYRTDGEAREAKKETATAKEEARHYGEAARQAEERRKGADDEAKLKQHELEEKQKQFDAERETREAALNSLKRQAKSALTDTVKARAAEAVARANAAQVGSKLQETIDDYAERVKKEVESRDGRITRLEGELKDCQKRLSPAN